jgi:hypothetical protein
MRAMLILSARLSALQVAARRSGSDRVVAEARKSATPLAFDKRTKTECASVR